MSLGYTGAWITRLAVPSAVHLAIIKTNSQSNKAAPFCKRKLYFTSLGTGKIAKCEARSLDDFSTFSALDYNLISFGIKRQTILVNNVLPLARVRSSYLAKDLLVCQTCPPSQQKPKHWIWFQNSTSGGEPQDICDSLTWACQRAGSFMTSVSMASQRHPCREVPPGTECYAFRRCLGWALLLCFKILCSALNDFSFPDVSQSYLESKANCVCDLLENHPESTSLHTLASRSPKNFHLLVTVWTSFLGVPARFQSVRGIMLDYLGSIVNSMASLVLASWLASHSTRKDFPCVCVCLCVHEGDPEAFLLSYWAQREVWGCRHPGSPCICHTGGEHWPHSLSPVLSTLDQYYSKGESHR